MKQDTFPSVALVYDRVNTPYGGAENVLLALHQAFPDAPLYTALYNPKNASWARVFSVRASFLNSLPLLRSAHRWLAWLMPAAFESFDLTPFDIVISVTSAEAKGVLTKPNQLHICYLLTPPRYLYQGKQHSLDSHWLLRMPLIRQAAQLMIRYLRWWDQAAVFRPDILIPISQRVKTRIRQFYPAVPSAPVMYPPIETEPAGKPAEMPLPKQYFLSISRLVSHKKLEIAIEACAAAGENLIIVGQGPEKKKLKQLAEKLSAQVLFLDKATPAELSVLYARCIAVLMPGEEDFGITALEANSFGKPVIIHRHSGAAELIQPGVHGIHSEDETAAAMQKAISQLKKTVFSASKIKQNPVKYGTNNFIRAFSEAVNTLWKEHQKRYD